MQILSFNIDQFILKINDYATIIISFLKNTFNNIIAIKNCNFFNLLNSTGIIINFLFSILYILIFITLLVFLCSIFNIIKTIIKWILYPFKLLIICIIKIISKLIPKSSIKQSITIDKYLIELQENISDLESKNNLMMK
ncbi:hypothetical protein AYWB_pIII03 (plasmid) [Aster yellows witches'-broom phytoplasma AYWB]|uniref:Uncharacterized protein n=1 Tax=Aster yellows witches'-broom phytoplasma (strain AYWB) TaxID=322098 RepID=Q2NIE3_AYWBP|nr:hypothetical protein [Aster yellows witches'-broom phytoplasma]ABC65800.1 hypothetical protein AYWB_pIII03 [Aster yellows witches'-broom phytoplasma AYWB]